jgi:hypothetical protein|eukprot:COSAG06_NODE_3149_length_5769_cov_76.274427_5_plen_562_part_00
MDRSITHGFCQRGQALPPAGLPCNDLHCPEPLQAVRLSRILHAPARRRAAVLSTTSCRRACCNYVEGEPKRYLQTQPHSQNNSKLKLTRPTMRPASMISMMLMGFAIGTADVAAARAGISSADPSSEETALSVALPSFGRMLQVVQEGVACLADFNADGVVGTDDLLDLLATFGRDVTDCSEQNAIVECLATVDEQAAAAASAAEQAAETCQTRNDEQRTTYEQAAAQTAAAHQQLLRALRCAPAPVVPFADVTGDVSYGGDGLTVTCHTGYADNGATSSTLQCTTAGTWEPLDGAPMLDCASIDPCSIEEDDCDVLADCAHTGPGTHECECTSGVAFGTGQVCSQCSPTCDIGQVLTAQCTSITDIACEAVIASEVLPDITGATLTYSNGQSYPTTATYACGDNEMSRTLQPDGTWSAAGELSCAPPPPPPPPEIESVSYCCMASDDASPYRMLRSSVGNSIAVGRSYTLRWECTPADASVKIEITHNNLPEPFLVEALSTDGNLPGQHENGVEWTVPDSLEVMSGYRMRVSSTVDDTLYDDSLSFQILDASGAAAGSGR